MKTYLFHVDGIHCKACKMLIEDILTEHASITAATVNMNKQTVRITAKFTKTDAEVLTEINALLTPHKYAVHLEQQVRIKDNSSLMTAIPIGLAVLALFFMLQKSGLVTMGFEGALTLPTALFIGVIASLSSCLAVVGGLILTLSAQVSHDTSSKRPLILFHVSRLISFAIFGAILGIIGNTIGINHTVTSLLGLLAALVMIILGINLLDVFSFTKNLQLTLPGGLHKKILKIENGYFAPIFVGSLTFFLPCGFTQSMQLASLSSGSAVQGSLIMTMFALGTLPMLALISFSSFTFANTRYSLVFYKSAGIIVIGLGLFAFIAGLAGMGIIRPLFTI